MDRQGDGKRSGSRSRAVARLTTLQRLRDDALAKNRQAMLQTIEDMIASEMRAMNAERQDSTAPPATDKESSHRG